MKIKKVMKLIKSKYSIAMAIFAFPALILNSWMPYKDLPNLFSSGYVVTKPMVEDVMRKNQSYLSDGNLDALLESFHDDFLMEIEHTTDRKETLNKSQYRKHYEMISAFGFTPSLKYEVVNFRSLAKNRFVVTLIMGQSFENDRLTFLNHDNVNFQTMELVNDDGQVKILRVTSKVRAVSSNFEKDKKNQLIVASRFPESTMPWTGE